MYQLILTIFSLIFAALNLSAHKFEGLSSSSEEFDEAFEVSAKSRNTNSSKKKKPKRNRSAFIIFSSETRPLLKKENLNSNEMMVKLAERWKLLSENEKKKYYDQADQEKDRYMLELNTFYRQNPNEVIQNKTKKNHIKKPCSAYAIYLKETKKEIKTENPDLKMADILKLVAQKWKALSDDVRYEFQRKAEIEKEITQAKIKQQSHGAEEYIFKKESTKKSSTSSSNTKRGQKSLEDSVKIEAESSSEQMPHSYESIEEPSLMKHQAMNFNFNYYNQQIQESVYYKQLNHRENEYNYPYYNQNLLFSQFEQTQYPRSNEFTSTNISNLLNYLPSAMFFKPTSEVYEERQNEQQAQETMYVKDEYDSQEENQYPTTATNTTPSSSGWNSYARSQEVLNDDFKLNDDDVNFEKYEVGYLFRDSEGAKCL